MSSAHSQRVLELLHLAGWFDGREVSVDPFIVPGLTAFAEAQRVLSEFGGIHVGECGSGINRATSDIEFDPKLGAHLARELRESEAALHTKLFPLGEVHRGHGYLIIDEHGRTYVLTDELSCLADTFSQSLEMLLRGIKS
ncbi:MAG TPA: SUKH-3 domain-containing protein [Pirellulales bacterium]|nr:SUKH-3 domain-containing protein [Pirellulales bacterium]